MVVAALRSLPLHRIGSLAGLAVSGLLLALREPLLDRVLPLRRKLVPLRLELVAHLGFLRRRHGEELLVQLLPVGVALLRRHGFHLGPVLPVPHDPLLWRQKVLMPPLSLRLLSGRRRLCKRRRGAACEQGRAKGCGRKS